MFLTAQRRKIPISKDLIFLVFRGQMTNILLITILVKSRNNSVFYILSFVIIKFFDKIYNFKIENSIINKNLI